MQTPSLFWPIVFGIGTLQGVILGGMLVQVPSSPRISNRLLAALVGVTALMIAEEFIDAANLYRTFPHALLSTMCLPLLIGPLLWLYTRTLLSKTVVFDRNALVHFAPFALALLYFIP